MSEQNEIEREISPAARLLSRLVVVALAAFMGVGASEVFMHATDRPTFYDAHPSPPQFGVIKNRELGAPVYVNMPSAAIRFEYDSNPRGYFGPNNEIVHTTNSMGFRGPEFPADKAADVIRIAFLGDSITFGEGVKDDEIFAVRTGEFLQEHIAKGKRIESFNFGVGGYNTDQAVTALEWKGLSVQPDAIVLGYVLNDAEPPLFEPKPDGTGYQRRTRKLDAYESRTQVRPPNTALYKSRLAQLVWKFVKERSFTENTLDGYRTLYAESSEGWQNSRKALARIGARCKEVAVPCLVVLFPVFYELDAYPLMDIHAMIEREAVGAGMSFIDMLPALQDRSGSDLWVHPTDQHPNEEVHAIAAQRIATALAEMGVGR